MPPPHNVLIMGAGQIGAFYDKPGSTAVLTHGHAFSASCEFNLLGFVDTNFGKAQEAAARWSCKAFRSYDEALAVAPVDVVCLATPDQTHASILKELIAYSPRLVFAEKPLAASHAEACEIVSLYNDQHIPLAVNYTRRFVPEFHRLQKRIQAGEWGNFLHGSGIYGKGLFHNGSHLLDLLRFLTGDYTVETVLDGCEDYHTGDASLSALLRATDGKQTFSLQVVDQNLYTHFELDLFFTKGRIRIPSGGQTIEHYNVVSYELVDGYQVLGKPEVIETSIQQAPALAAQNINGYLQTGEALQCPGQEALAVLRLCEDIRGKSLFSKATTGF